MEKEAESTASQMQELRVQLEKVQNQQVEDSRDMSKQQKTTERYLTKRQMLTSRKEECSRNVRDLGVLPEEAFEKYINERLDKVCTCTLQRLSISPLTLLSCPACEQTAHSQ